MTIIGLDISANRIAWAYLRDGQYGGSHRVECAGGIPCGLIQSTAYRLAIHPEQCVYCLETNTRPMLVHKGRVSPRMVQAYMRSRWVEGRLLQDLGLDEPVPITRKRNGWSVDHGSRIYSMQADSHTKDSRRQRMQLIYPAALNVTQDEIDALAVAHECAIALKMARAK